MRVPLPTSYAAVKMRLASFELAWAAVSPLLALALRDPQIFCRDAIADVILYSVISAACSLLFFTVFRLHDGLYSCFSRCDLQDIAKAACCAEATTCIFAF